jgi:hypothetical protein
MCACFRICVYICSALYMCLYKYVGSRPRSKLVRRSVRLTLHEGNPVGDSTLVAIWDKHYLVEKVATACSVYVNSGMGPHFFVILGVPGELRFNRGSITPRRSTRNSMYMCVYR